MDNDSPFSKDIPVPAPDPPSPPSFRTFPLPPPPPHYQLSPPSFRCSIGVSQPQRFPFPPPNKTHSKKSSPLHPTATPHSSIQTPSIRSFQFTHPPPVRPWSSPPPSIQSQSTPNGRLKQNIPNLSAIDFTRLPPNICSSNQVFNTIPEKFIILGTIPILGWLKTFVIRHFAVF